MMTIPGAPGNTGDAERDKVLADMIAARANYVEVMGMRLVTGRTFTEARPNGAIEAIIDTALATRYFPKSSPLGAQFRLGERTLAIVGVVQQARLYDVHADGRPQILIRAEDLGVRPLYFVMRTNREPHSLVPEVRAAMRRIDPRVPVGETRTMNDIVEASLSPQAIGGALIGAPGIYFANGLIRGLLVGVSPSDPLTLLGAAVGLLLVTMATCYVPARRALRIEPAQLLRHE